MIQKKAITFLILIVVVGLTVDLTYNKGCAEEIITNVRAYPHLQVLNDPESNIEERRNAASRLSYLGSPKAFDPFVQIVKDGSENIGIRHKAARGLGNIGDKRAVPVLSSIVIDSHEEKNLRAISILALGKFGGKEAIDTLSQLSYDNDAMIRFKAVQALGQTNDEGVLQSTMIALQDPDKFVKAEAVHTLGELGNPSHVPIIIDILENTNDNFIKIA